MRNPTNEQIGRLVSDAIKRGNTTNKDVAEKIGVPLATFSRKINGHGAFSFPEVLKVAQVLGEPVENFSPDHKPDDNAIDQDVYSITDVMRKLGKSRDYVLDLIHTGQLDAIQPVRAYMITRRSYERFIGK